MEYVQAGVSIAGEQFQPELTERRGLSSPEQRWIYR